MTRDATTAFARTLVDEWARAGVVGAAIAPGSRSAPLALALAGDGRIPVHVFLDERSASFFALGAAKASGRPAVVLCTSGTAAAHFHAAVLEAHHARVPLLVCTADRPPELRGVGAGQTIDQTKLYGDVVRWFVDPGPPDDRPGVGAEWRSLASRAVAECSGPPAGPVHLNLPFREPLVPTGAPLVDAPGREDGRPWHAVAAGRPAPTDAAAARLVEQVRGAPRGLLVAGWGAGVSPAVAARFATAAGWPILADPLSGLRSGPHAVSTYEALLRGPGFAGARRPELVVRLGAPTTGKTLNQWLDPSVAQVLVDPDRSWLDPAHAASDVVVADPEALLDAVADALGSGPAPRPSSWCDEWLTAERTARTTIDSLLDDWSEPFEGRVARDVVAAVPDDVPLVIGSSMPVRDVEAFARPREGGRLLSNRGVNGIDGFVSTVLGVGAGADGASVGLCGDLTLLHDSTGLLGAAHRGVDATFVVVDNDGGGIFSFLPQAELPEHFEALFGTPHGVDLVALARSHGVDADRVELADDLGPALEASIHRGGVRVIVVPTDRATNVARHQEVWTAVAAAL